MSEFKLGSPGEMGAIVKDNVAHAMDPRLDPERDRDELVATTGASSWEFYKVPASSITASSINFANIVTQGENRVQTDKFFIEYDLDISQDLKPEDNQDQSEWKALRFENLRTTFRAIFGTGETLDRTQVSLAQDESSRAVASFDRITNNIMNSFGLKTFPLQRATEQIRVQVNGQQFQSVPADTIHQRGEFWSQYQQSQYLGDVCPVIKQEAHVTPQVEEFPYGHSLNDDTADVVHQGVSAGFRTHPNNPQSMNEHTNKIHLKEQYIKTDEARWKKQADWTDISTEQLPFTIHQKWHIMEPVLCSPLNQRLFDQMGRAIWNVSQLQIDQTLGKTVNMISSPFMCPSMEIIDMKTNFTNVSVCQHVANVQYPLPAECKLTISDFVPFRTRNVASLEAVNATTQVESAVFPLSFVPASIYISAEPAKDKASNQTCLNGSAVIDKIDISLGNYTRLLVMATPQELQNISVQNGLSNITQPQFRGYWTSGNVVKSAPGTKLRGTLGGKGSFLRLIPGVDLVIPEQQLVPATACNSLPFQVRMDIKRMQGVFPAETFDINVIFEQEGVLTLKPQTAFYEMAPIKDPSSVLQRQVNRQQYLSAAYMGGGVWDNVRLASRSFQKAAKGNDVLTKTIKKIVDKKVEKKRKRKPDIEEKTGEEEAFEAFKKKQKI